MILLEYGEILDNTTKQNLISYYSKPNKDVLYSVHYNFNQLKWKGNSRETNFRLAAHTVLKGLTSNSSNIEEVEAKIKQLSLEELSSLINSNTSTNSEAMLVAKQKLEQTTSIYNEYKNRISSQENFSESQINDVARSFMANQLSLKDTISSIFKANSKTALTQKIYVSTKIETIEVVNTNKFFVKIFFFEKKIRFSLMPQIK